MRRRYRAELQRVNEAMRELEDELEVVKNTLAKCAQVRRSVPSPQPWCGRRLPVQRAVAAQDLGRRRADVTSHKADLAKKKASLEKARKKQLEIKAHAENECVRPSLAAPVLPLSLRPPSFWLGPRHASLPRIVRRINCAYTVRVRNNVQRLAGIAPGARLRAYVRRCLHQYMCVHVDRDSSFYVRARRCRDRSIDVRACRCRCRCRERGVGRRYIRYLKTDDLETKAKQIDDIFLQEEQNQKQVDRELSLLKEDMFRESQVSQSGRALGSRAGRVRSGVLWGARRVLP